MRAYSLECKHSCLGIVALKNKQETKGRHEKAEERRVWWDLVVDPSGLYVAPQMVSHTATSCLGADDNLKVSVRGSEGVHLLIVSNVRARL